MASRILITHPNRQHSHQLALALHDRQRLAEYWTGVPARPLTTQALMRPLARRLEKHALLPLPGHRVRHNIVSPVLRRVVQTLLPHAWAVRGVHQSMAWFDRWCAARLDTVEADAVICYENAALHTFRAAHERGMTTILDAASFHHAWQDRHYDYPESDAAHKRITAHKDQEIAEADHVLTVSNLARQSYIEGGVSPECVTAIPVGCDLARFSRSDEGQRTDSEAPFTFMFAGHAGRRKGIDTLIDASVQLDRQGISHRIWVAGGEDPGIPWDDAPSLTRLGRLSQEQLAERFRDADCLVLPSRHDSFGMVVVEALATGCPVMVSEQTGAKEAMRPGESGWIVPAEDTSAWTDQMAWCVSHPQQVHAMAPAAHADAQNYTWARYRNRVSSFLERLLEESDLQRG